jgi:hypothetical protein
MAPFRIIVSRRIASRGTRVSVARPTTVTGAFDEQEIAPIQFDIAAGDRCRDREPGGQYGYPDGEPADDEQGQSSDERPSDRGPRRLWHEQQPDRISLSKRRWTDRLNPAGRDQSKPFGAEP